jgi:hypothetical protein
VGGFILSVEMSLKDGARTDVIANRSQSALYKAAGKGQEEIVDLLLWAGASSLVTGGVDASADME